MSGTASSIAAVSSNAPDIFPGIAVIPCRGSVPYIFTNDIRNDDLNPDPFPVISIFLFFLQEDLYLLVYPIEFVIREWIRHNPVFVLADFGSEVSERICDL